MLERFEIVKSTAGHDIGNIYFINEVLKDNYVLLVDGKTRKISNPKKKSLKHIKSLNVVEIKLKDVFEDKSKMIDGEIRKYLKV